MKRKKYGFDPAGWAAHERRVAEGLYNLAECLLNGSEDVKHLSLASSGLVDGLTAVVEANERDDLAIAQALVEEDPSEAAAARHRARAWRRLWRRLPRPPRASRVSMGRIRASKAPRPNGVSSRPAFMRNEASEDAYTEAQTPPDPERPDRRGESLELGVAAALRELTDEVRQLRAEVQALLDESWRASSPTAPEPRYLSPDEACVELGVSRASFDRWLADPSTGLADVVFQPGGPGTKVIVPMDAFVAWWGRPRSRGTARARRRA